MQALILRTALIAMLLVAATIAHAQSEDEPTWTINLKEAEIGEFIDQVARISGRNFVVDPRVRGQVTVVSSTPLDADGVYELFLSVLRVHGFAAVPAGDVVRIVQQTLAKQSSNERDFEAEADGEAIITRVIQARHVAASDLISILRPLVPQYGHVAAVEAPNVVIISDHAENIRRLESIIREADVARESEVEVVPLKDAWVENVVELLETLAPQQLGRDATGPQAVQLVANARNNSLVLRGRPDAMADLRDLIERLDTPASNIGSTRVFRLNHSDAEELAGILSGILAEQEGGESSTGVRTSVQADPSLNALIVRGDPTTLAEVGGILDQLDVRRTQVLIEAAIVEVSMSGRRNVGVDLAIADLDGESTPLFLSPLGQALEGLLGPSIAEGGITPGDLAEGASGITSPTLAVARLSDGISFGAILQAISTHGDSDLLSTPSILTLDNAEATIVVGQNVPFRTGSFTTTGEGSQNPFTTIQREDVGITLKVVPHIHDGDAVRLQVEQEVSSVESGASVGNQSFSDIVTNKRTISTTILADHGQTIVLGGLIQDDIQETGRKVPLLGDIPIAGALFRSSSTERTKRNLLVFLRPTILRDPDDVSDVNARKYRSVWEVQQHKRGQPDDQTPEQPPDLDRIYQGRIPQDAEQDDSGD